jgi:hypothetical protein
MSKGKRASPRVKKFPYREGSWLAVPLRQRRVYAPGIVARMAPRGRIILGYLFGTKYREIPGMDAVKSLQPALAIRRLRAGDLGLVNGEWRVVGEAEGWRRAYWPMPQVVRRDDLTKLAWQESYSDSNPNELITEEVVSFDVAGLEGSGLYELSAHGEISTTISLPIKHDAGERKYLRPDGLQRDAVHYC